MFSPPDEAEEVPPTSVEEGPQASMSIEEQPWTERCRLRMQCSSALWPITVGIAVIRPFAPLGMEERSKSAGAPVAVGEALPFVIEPRRERMRFLLTERSLKAVGSVLADSISAIEVERADTTCDAGGGESWC